MLVADDNVRNHADLKKGAERQTLWEKAGYNIISMKEELSLYKIIKIPLDK